MEQTQFHGDYFSAICPFPHDGHKESHPSMMVYEDGFVCLGCGKKGKLEYLWKQVDKSDNFLQSVSPAKPNILPKWASWGKRFGDIEDIASAAYHNLCRFEGHQSFFKNRKINQFIDAGYFGFIDGWALFPVMDKDGKIIDIVVRAAGQGKGGTKYVVRPSNDREIPNIYVPNWNRVLNNDTVYVVYGIIDSWAFEDLCLPCITGTTGKSLSPVQLKPLDKKFVIIPDRYEEDAAYHLANLLGWKARVHRIKYPDGCKDPDDIRMKFGRNVLEEYIGA
jgi:hypothetical protein